MAEQRDTPLTYSDSSPFVRLLSTPGRVKILDVLLRRHTSHLTAGEIADQAGIDEGTFSRNKEIFIDLNIVDTTREGRQTVYQLNTESEVVQHFGQAHTALLAHAETIHDELGPEEQEGTEHDHESITHRDDDRHGERRGQDKLTEGMMSGNA